LPQEIAGRACSVSLLPPSNPSIGADRRTLLSLQKLQAKNIVLPNAGDGCDGATLVQA
jgi:hypothetical protein